MVEIPSRLLFPRSDGLRCPCTTRNRFGHDTRFLHRQPLEALNRMILSGWLLFGGQVSWVVEADGQRIRHGGDMMFQGWWWLASSSARMILRSRLAGAAPMPSRGVLSRYRLWRPVRCCGVFLPRGRDARRQDVRALTADSAAHPVAHRLRRKPSLCLRVPRGPSCSKDTAISRSMSKSRR